jgi:hypothetical protein
LTDKGNEFENDAVGSRKPVDKPDEFTEVLLQAVDYGLLIPGEIVRSAIYNRIEMSYQVRRDEIPEKLPIFHKALQELLGSIVVATIEKSIARELYGRLGLNFTEHRNWTLLEYVEEAKTKRGGTT